MARLQQFYREKIVPQLKSELGLKNTMEVPKIIKITVNMGVGEAVADRKVVDAAVGDMTKITGQKPVLCKAKKAVAAFKLREGLPIGCKVTLRGARMYEFLDRLINVAMPRIRDFRGVSAARLRRPRQLHAGREGTDHFPGDPVRHRSTSCAAWTSRSPPRRATTSRDARCWKPSTSRSATKADQETVWPRPT